MKSKKVFFCVLFVFSNVYMLYAQKDTINNEWLVDKFELYSKSHSSTLLFLHTDKTLYTNNEDIWFSAYLISKGHESLQEHHTLSVVLIREDNRKISLQSKYLIESGLGNGNLTLPDTIPPGKYQLLAYTNVLDKNFNPTALFKQPITIKTINELSFISTLKLLDTVAGTNLIRAQVAVSDKEGRTLKGVAIKYSIGKKMFPPVFTNNLGISIINIPSNDFGTDELLATVNYKKESQYLNIKLPYLTPKNIHIRFYPEGGNMAEGVSNVIACEATTSDGLPIATKGILYKNEKAIDTIVTNNYGICIFKLMSEPNVSYSLKIPQNSYQQRDSIYFLPTSIIDGVAIHIENAIANDTLTFAVSCKQKKQIKILIHNYRKPYAFFNQGIGPQEQKIRVALKSMPKGIAAVTILDNLGRPIAERLFFAHYDEKVIAEIKTDKQEYSNKEKVILNLNFTDKTGKPIDGLVSVACVQDNRIEKDISQDIETYVYLNDDLGHLPIFILQRGYTDKKYLENILMVKGWRRYTWQDLKGVSVSDTIQQNHSLEISGYVTYSNKPIKKNLPVVLISGSALKILNTDNHGLFSLNYEDLIVGPGKRSWMMVNGKNKEDYKIQINDPYQKYNQNLSNQITFENRGYNLNVQNSQQQVLSDFEKRTILKEVIITSNSSNSMHGAKGANACGDYVCVNNILNCNNHLNGGFKPIKGVRYFERFEKMVQVIYEGCAIDDNAPALIVPAINTSKEFYGADYNQPGSSQIQYVSTLFWKPAIVVQNGRATCSFYTSDISGKFKIVAQGVTSDDVLYGGNGFIVKTNRN